MEEQIAIIKEEFQPSIVTRFNKKMGRCESG